MKVSGGDERNLTNHPDPEDGAPNWSPDGRRIVFQSDRGGRRRGGAEIYTMNLDGSRIRRLTYNTSFDGQPNWSPNGRRISFQSNRDDVDEEHRRDLHHARDGRDQRRLTFHAFPDFAPAWSPNGCKIAYYGFPDITAEDPFANEDVFTINVDGSHQKHLTNNPAFDFAPDWQPRRDHADRSSCRR